MLAPPLLRGHPLTRTTSASLLLSFLLHFSLHCRSVRCYFFRGNVALLSRSLAASRRSGLLALLLPMDALLSCTPPAWQPPLVRTFSVSLPLCLVPHLSLQWHSACSRFVRLTEAPIAWAVLAFQTLRFLVISPLAAWSDTMFSATRLAATLQPPKRRMHL